MMNKEMFKNINQSYLKEMEDYVQLKQIRLSTLMAQFSVNKKIPYKYKTNKMEHF